MADASSMTTRANCRCTDGLADLRPPAHLQEPVVAVDVEALELLARLPLDPETGDVGLRRPDVAAERDLVAAGVATMVFGYPGRPELAYPKGSIGLDWGADCFVGVVGLVDEDRRSRPAAC